MRPLVPLLCAFFLGCSRTESRPAAPAPDRSRASAARSAGPPVKFSQASFPCCANDRVRQVVVAYAGAQEALSRDDLASVRTWLADLARKAAEATEDSTLSGDSRVMTATVAELAGGSEPASLAQVRATFPALSSKVIVLAQANRGGSKAVAVAWCPVTNANWLQAAPELQNPYLGALEASSGVFRP
jgi:hypothetical protein